MKYDISLTDKFGYIHFAVYADSISQARRQVAGRGRIDRIYHSGKLVWERVSGVAVSTKRFAPDATLIKR